VSEYIIGIDIREVVGLGFGKGVLMWKKGFTLCILHLAKLKTVH
jgi:hypothetical protein